MLLQIKIIHAPFHPHLFALFCYVFFLVYATDHLNVTGILYLNVRNQMSYPRKAHKFKKNPETLQTPYLTVETHLILHLPSSCEPFSFIANK